MKRKSRRTKFVFGSSSFGNDPALEGVIKDHLVAPPPTKGVAMDLIDDVLKAWGLAQDERYAARYVLSSLKYEYVLVIGQIIMNITEQALKQKPEMVQTPEKEEVVEEEAFTEASTNWNPIFRDIWELANLNSWSWFDVVKALEEEGVLWLAIDQLKEWLKSNTTSN